MVRSRLLQAGMVALAAVLWMPASGRADEEKPAPGGIVGLQVENDLFGGSSDRDYTHGMRLSYFTPEGDVPDWLKTGASYMPFFAQEGKLRTGYELGQDIFTPDDISLKQLQPNQRPYAGWLYFGAGLVSDTGERVDDLNLEVGVVGPYSWAEDVQRGWHNVIGSPQPQGWDNQIKNEPGFVLTYERKWRSMWEFPVVGFDADLTPSAGAALGNVFTYGSVGLMARLGQDLPNDYGPPRIRPSLPGSDYFAPVPDGFGWYLFGGVEGRAVARNIFLDGNTFESSSSIDKKPLVGDLQVGAALIVGKYRLSYTQIFRTKEYYGQGATDSFGSINLSVHF
jgi:lipid A 3-O-deacylase